MTEKTVSDNIMTPEFRVSYPHVFEAQSKDDGSKVYTMACLFPKGANLDALKKDAMRALTEKFGADQTKWPKNLKSPFRDQGEKEGDGYEAGAIFINVTSRQKPGLVDRSNQPIIDPSEFYEGCYARATVRAFYYDKKGNKGVSFGLRNIQKIRDGERLGNRRSATEEFAPIEGADAGGGTDATSLFA
jgi:hypothetical protein